MTNNDNNILPEEEYCHYSGLPSATFYENIEKEEINRKKMQEKESKTKQHFYTSLAKSVVRIAAGITLCYGDLLLAGALLIAAEILGIVEEL